jgi:hypothetical protein
LGRDVDDDDDNNNNNNNNVLTKIALEWKSRVHTTDIFVTVKHYSVQKLVDFSEE